MVQMGAVRPPRILVLTIDGFVSAQGDGSMPGCSDKITLELFDYDMIVRLAPTRFPHPGCS